MYSNWRRDTLRKESPDLKITELSKAMGIEWGKLTEDQKKKWTNKALEARAEYDIKVSAALNRDKHTPAPAKKAATKVAVRKNSSSSLSSLDEKPVKKTAAPASSDSDESSL